MRTFWVTMFLSKYCRFMHTSVLIRETPLWESYKTNSKRDKRRKKNKIGCHTYLSCQKMNKSIYLGLHSLQKKKVVSATLILLTIRLGKLDLLFTYLSLFDPLMLPPHYLVSIVFSP